MLLVIDNHDSFTWNLVQAFAVLGHEVRVVRNDELSAEAALATGAAGIVISPGPGRPEGAGVSLPLIRLAAGRVPLLGVCLGHQAIGVAYGGRVGRAPVLMHGKTSDIHHDGRTIFEGLPNPFVATRYHSLVVEPDSVPADLEVSAWTRDGVIMGLRHRRLPIEGVQFHPESILTTEGTRLLAGFPGGPRPRASAGV